MKVAAIVPALNEQENVWNVLKVLLSSEDIDEVILVDDGSTDRTPDIGRELGAKVISLQKKGGSGKGNAVSQGLKATSAEVVFFCDADLIGLSKNHIFSLLQPVLKNEAVMCVGVRDRLLGFPQTVIKIDPLLAIAGERAVSRSLLGKIPYKFTKGFSIESALNYYCRVNNLPVKYVLLNGLNHTIKEKKWGFFKGFLQRMKLISHVFKIRIILGVRKTLFSRGENFLRRKPTNWDQYLGLSIFPYGVFKGYKKFIKQIKKDWPQKGGKILELGSGSGRNSFWMSRLLPVSEIVLVDFNEKILEKSRKFFFGKDVSVRFVKQNILKLDLREKFDLIHNAGVLEHFSPEYQEEVIKIHKKHIKKGGWIISYVPTPDLGYRFWRSFQEFLGIWRFTDEKPLKSSELINLFKKKGFKILGSNKVWRWYLTEVGILGCRIRT